MYDKIINVKSYIILDIHSIKFKLYLVETHIKHRRLLHACMDIYTIIGTVCQITYRDYFCLSLLSLNYYYNLYSATRIFKLLLPFQYTNFFFSFHINDQSSPRTYYENPLRRNPKLEIWMSSFIGQHFSHQHTTPSLI